MIYTLSKCVSNARERECACARKDGEERGMDEWRAGSAVLHAGQHMWYRANIYIIHSVTYVEVCTYLHFAV